MVVYKTEEEIETIKEGAVLLGKAHGLVASLIKEGVKTKDLDKKAEEFISDHGGKPSFKGYNGFPYKAKAFLKLERLLLFIIMNKLN